MMYCCGCVSVFSIVGMGTGFVITAWLAVQFASRVAGLAPDGSAAERSVAVPAGRGPQAAGAVHLPGRPGTPALRRRLQRRHPYV